MYEHSNTGTPCAENPDYDPTITFNIDTNNEYLYDGNNNCDCTMHQSWENWNKVGNYECGSTFAIPFFLSYQVIAGWLILNLIIAAIIDGLSLAQADRAQLIT